MNPDRRAEHQWLQRLIGEWVFEPEPVGPDGKVEGMSGSESVRMLGEAWALCESEMQVGAGGEDGDRIELVHQDERVLSSSVLDPDGQWREFMRTRYRRNPLR